MAYEGLDHASCLGAGFACESNQLAARGCSLPSHTRREGCRNGALLGRATYQAFPALKAMPVQPCGAGLQSTMDPAPVAEHGQSLFASPAFPEAQIAQDQT